MKVTTIIDPSREEEVIIYTKKRSPLSDAIEDLCTEKAADLIGYSENEARILDPSEVICFSAEEKRIIARTFDGCLSVRTRLYQLEEQLPDAFIRINQSCIANTKQIKKFDTSISGTLIVIFKDGHRDYVSRRSLKKVKERLGLK